MADAARCRAGELQECRGGRHQHRFCWQEHGGPAVEARTSQGFGLSLFDMVASGMAGTATTHFDPAGLRCEMVVELEADRRRAIHPPD